MNCYVSSHVGKVRALYRKTLHNYAGYNTVRDLLDGFFNDLSEAFRDGNPTIAIEISNYHPLFLGASGENILGSTLSEADLELTIARSYGFQDFDLVPASGIDHFFEAAVDFLLAGNKEELVALLDRKPHLVQARSGFGHQATLLHYAGSNGVELWRQVVPYNLPELVEVLLQKGAKKKATANFYGGLYDTKTLVETSAHPKGAGISNELIRLLS